MSNLVLHEVRHGITVGEKSLLYGSIQVDDNGTTIEKTTVEVAQIEYTAERVDTTDGTVTDLAIIPTVTDGNYTIKAVIIGRCIGGISGGNNGDGAHFIIVGAFKNIGAGAVQIGSTAVIFSEKSQGAYDGVFAVSGDDVKIQIQGDTNNNMIWTAYYKAYEIKLNP